MFIQNGKPSQNGYIECFNKMFREDILDAYLFDDPQQVQRMANDWIWMYNNDRPHESLDNLTPTHFNRIINTSNKLLKTSIFECG